MRKTRFLIAETALLALGLGLLGCGKREGSMNVLGPNVGSETSNLASGGPPVAREHESRSDRVIDPDDFVRHVDNPNFPLVPGTVFKYAANTPEGLETVEVRVGRDTRKILGVATTVVRDKVFLNGSLKEDTIDWYAQDEDGTVWYFGEDTKEYEDGVVVSTAGTWLAGKDGAKPGFIMLAHPRVGRSYRQEFAQGVAEDRASVVSLKETVSVPFGTFHDCLQTLETTPLNPASREYKYYARRIGHILTVSIPDGQRSELTSVTR